jgi:hypothetical protein
MGLSCRAGGGHIYITGLVRHSEAFESGSGIVAGVVAVSQIAFYRNYAPKVYFQSSETTGLTVNPGIQFEDKRTSWWSRYAYGDYYGNPWFLYDIDWDGDGQTAHSGAVTFDEELVFDSQHNVYRQASGIQTSTLPLEYIFSDSGDYLTTLYITDGMETTTMQIPVNVLQEPATLALLGFGGLFLRKINCEPNNYKVQA